jgi:hypothetical protein
MAKFELYKSSNGEYRWRLKASNGQVIATGGEGSPRVLRRKEASMPLSASLLPLQ